MLAKKSHKIPPTARRSHYVFVDFENVSNVDLRLIEKRSVLVTLLLGQKQKKLNVSLVHQIQRHVEQVRLIEVGASGRNALDLTLCYYLGQAVFSAPKARFHLVSKDHDFDPLIAHLQRDGIRVLRHRAFSKEMFAVRSKATEQPLHLEPGEPEIVPVDRFAKLVLRLNRPSSARPKSEACLRAHIRTVYGNKLSEAGVIAVVNELIKDRIVAMDDAGKVQYEVQALGEGVPSLS